MQRIYVLFFISLASRRIEYLACTSNPDGAWTAQQARNLAMQLGEEQPVRFLIRDRDTKFSHAFDEVFRSEGLKVIRTPVQAPNANAHAERWVRTVRAESSAGPRAFSFVGLGSSTSGRYARDTDELLADGFGETDPRSRRRERPARRSRQRELQEDGVSKPVRVTW